MKNENEWPISPTFLSLRQGCNEDSANYNADGIYYTDYLRGFLADLSHDQNIQNALSLFQFVPKDFLPHDPNAENPNEITKDPTKATVILNEPVDNKIAEILDRQGKKIVRIDSGTYVNNGRLCDAFRKWNSKHICSCFIQDSIVGIFADETLNNLWPYSDEYRQRLDELVSNLNQTREEISQIVCEIAKPGDIKRLYIHYTCPFSLFEEHIFPVYSQGRIIACLMLGQMARSSFKKEKTVIYKEGMYKIDPMNVYYLDKIDYLSESDWGKKVDTICKHIDIFEKRLEDRIVRRNNGFISYAFSSIEKKFKESVKKINIKHLDAIPKFSEALNDAFDGIRNKFDSSNDGFIRMFALTIDIKHDKLVPIGWSGTEFAPIDDYNFELKRLKGIEKLPYYKYKEAVYNAASQKIKDSYDEENGDLFVVGWLAGSEVAYIVWKRHDEALNKRNYPFKEYKRALSDFYSVVLESYSYIRGAKLELLLETVIQESAHESAHFILPTIDAVENHLNVIPKYMILPRFSEKYYKDVDSFEKYREEVLESLNQLREINYGSSLIFSSDLQISKNYVQVTELLYKLKKTLNERALDGHKIINSFQDKKIGKAKIDAKYLNHALYNLLDNAIKYGYEGSYIRIHMGVDRKKGVLIIKVISYGIEIPEGALIYQLFERGIEASRIAKGTGIGMYIVNKICKAHGGNVTHISEKLSDYNIPILFNYKYRNILANKNSLQDINNFEKELSKLSGSIEYEVVCDTRFVKYAYVFSSRIKNPTYRNTFSIILPLK